MKIKKLYTILKSELRGDVGVEGNVVWTGMMSGCRQVRYRCGWETYSIEIDVALNFFSILLSQFFFLYLRFSKGIFILSRFFFFFFFFFFSMSVSECLPWINMSVWVSDSLSVCLSVSQSVNQSIFNLSFFPLFLSFFLSFRYTYTKHIGKYFQLASPFLSLA